MNSPANNPIVERIQSEAGIPGLLDALVERLDPTDLQSLFLEVYRRRAGRIKPSRLLERFEQDLFVRPTNSEPARLTEFDRLIWSLLPDQYIPVELSPVGPLGSNSAIATVDQNNAVTTIRNTEVVADPTNVLALECATRRRRILRADPLSREPVRLAASHRVLRAQAYRSPLARAHFRLLGLVAGGRDEGGFQFEGTNLIEQLGFYLRLLRGASRLGYVANRVRVALTSLEPEREQVLTNRVLETLRLAYPEVRCAFDPDRESGRGYYVGACFKIYASNQAGVECELIDGGFTTWTRQLLSNAKERLLISGLGIEVLLDRFA